jgi:hypothetical protein
MYLNFTKSCVVAFCCLLSSSLMAKDAVPVAGQGLRKPICFIENKGQVVDNSKKPRADIQYQLSAPGMSLYIGNGQLHYQFRQFEGKEAARTRIYNANVTLMGANPNARVEAMDEQAYFENYYSAQSGENGFTAHSYNKIVYHDIYPGIDWVLYINEAKVEYDFVVRAGADARKIQIAYEGAKLRLLPNGSLTAETPMGQITEKTPVSYEKGTGKPVASSFVVKDNVVSFKTAPCNGTLVIDPYILWSTYYGGANEDVVTSVRSSGNANTFVGGYTKSAGLGFGTGFDLSYSAGFDAFAARYNSGGTLQWATYFGSTGEDLGTCLAIDLAGTSIFLGGYTTSLGTGLTTGGVWHTTNRGLNDGFVLKLSASTGTRTWCTFWGGTGEDYVHGIAVDNAGNPCITGQTHSTVAADIISGAGVYQNSLSGSADAFVARFNGGSGAISFSTYYGGSGQDEGFGVAFDGTNNVIVTGQTNSAGGMASAGAHQTTLSGTNDAFIAKFNTTGTSRTWGTYFGGSGDEAGKGVFCNSQTSEIAVVGNTTSTSAISTAKSHQTAYGGGLQDAFVAYFRPTGVIKWGSYYGGSNIEYGERVCFDRNKNIVIAGATFSSNGIATPGTYQATIGGDYDAFVAKFNSLGQRLWGTYFGNTLYDYAYDVAIDTFSGQMVIGGHTSSNIGIASVGAQQTGFGGGLYDGFVTRFRPDTLVSIAQPYTDTLLCVGGTFSVAGTVNAAVNFAAGNVFTVELSNAFGSFAAPIVIGSLAGTASANIPVTIPGTVPPGNGYRMRIVASKPAFTSPDQYVDIKILAALPATTVTATTPVCLGGVLALDVNASFPVTSYNWVGPAGSGFASTSKNPSIPAVTMANAGVYTVVVAHTGCPSRVDTIGVVVNNVTPPTPTVSSTSPVCNLGTLNLFATPGTTGTITYSWTGPGGFTSTMQNPTVTPITSTGAGVYNLVDVVDGCSSAVASVTVAVTPNSPTSINISVAPHDTICQGDTVTFTAALVNGGVTPALQWYKNGSAVVGANSSVWTAPGLINNDMIYATMASNTVCPMPIVANSNTIKMTVINNAPLAYISVTPGSSVAPGTTVTFTSAVYNGGISPLYQWKKNGLNIPGATNSTYVMISSGASETVTLFFTNTMQCAIPSSVTSNAITIRSNVGVTNVGTSIDNIGLFPNPNKGSFTVQGDVIGGNIELMSLRVINPLGQVVFSGEASIKQGMLYQDMDLRHLADGMYMLHLSAEGHAKVIRFTIQH